MTSPIVPRDNGSIMFPQRLAEEDRTLFSPDSQPGSNDAITDPFHMGYDLAALFDAGDATFYSDVMDALPSASTQPLSHFGISEEDFSRLPSQYADHLVQQQPVTFRTETLTEDDVLEANRSAPDPRSHIQEPDYKTYAYDYEIPLFSTYKHEVQARDYWAPEQPLHVWGMWDSAVPVDSTGLADEIAKHFPGSGDSHITGNDEFGDSARDVDPSRQTSAHQTHRSTSNRRQCYGYHEVLDKPQVLASPFPEAQPRHPCAECVFAGKGAECDGSPCRRCKRLVRKACSGKVHIWGVQAHTPLLNELIFFDIEETLKLLAGLRLDIDLLTFPGKNRQKNSLEKCFNHSGHILCHIDQGSRYQAYSSTSVTICVERLATKATARTASSGPLILPVFSEEQLDIFTDKQAPKAQIQSFSEPDRSIITTAWRCAYYLGLLFNWSAHHVLVDESTLHERQIRLPMSKNLILEVMYAIAYRIQKLGTKLLQLVNETLYAKPYGSQRNYDPAAILCALRILYSSVGQFQKLKGNWRFAGIAKLEAFLEGLNFRAPAAIRVIQKYRHRHLGILCEATPVPPTLISLIKDSAVARSMATFAFERFRPEGLCGIGGLDK
ncbi:hypothetical protein QBC34DRAFT_87497 [Podospora aff. communis PSN243]|uniref:Zn(2)-C6 fungal-type domain-containing protein n=1 Tax=Podospora aff. communis PSN243 TaxID=3040156 RepID=A0AAV9GP01_9PEZI|nr:hypothetical protein QBC34DRAFT_87497 [Podospora aff. communis PSN243]